jgi:hypothetical protein
VYLDRWPGQAPPCNLLLRRGIADLSWRTLRNLVAEPIPNPYDPNRPFVINRSIDFGTLGWLDPRRGIPLYGPDRFLGHGILTVIDPDPDVVLLREGPGSEAFALYPERPQGSSFSARWMGDVDLYSGYSDEDYGGVVVTVVPVPEPATGALLLAGLFAVSTRRRLR